MAEGGVRLALVVFAGTFDRVHYALAMAAAALAINRPVTLFFTMGAIRALLRPEGATAGWHRLLPGEDGAAPAEADRRLRVSGLGGFDELLEACLALGAEIMVCEMGLRAVGLAAGDLRDDLAVAPGGLATFLGEMGPGTAIVFV